MDELDLLRSLTKCKHLKYRFAGVYAADNFPLILVGNTFMIINSDKSDREGTHWLLLCNRNGEHVFVEPLALPMHYYNHVCERLSYADFGVKEILKLPMQKQKSNLCGLFCIYIAHYVFSGYYPDIPLIDENQLPKFMRHMT